MLNHTNTFTGVAQNLNLSVTTVIKIFDTYVECRRAILPKIICFDEFYRSRKTTDKYAFVMADFQTNKIIDVYHSRRKDKLDSYFSRIPQKERDNVEYIIIDMWDTYRDLAEILFKNAKIAVDSFHVIKHLNEAMINIRLRIMRKYDKNTKSLYSNDMYYYMLKKFHYFFVKEFDDIYDGLIEIRKMKTKWDKYEIRKYLLSINSDLKYAYELKEKYREFNLTASYNNCDIELDNLIDELKTLKSLNINVVNSIYYKEDKKEIINIKNLSPGTKANILMEYIVFKDTKVPLLIDQPEDNIDNKTIYKVLTDWFTTLKNKRQVIVATHDANIVVNGDAENVIICEQKNDNEFVYEYGALETANVLEKISNILDGGNEAIKRRLLKYGE